MSDHYSPNYVDEPAEEVNDEYSNDDLFNITSWGADLSFREIITMYEEGELLKPELQRKYVWEKIEASRFVESLLLGLPVPSIFLAESTNETKLIVDGYQRIMTVYDYVRGVFSKDGKIFKLTNSEKINKRWRGKAFSELSESDQRKIRKASIHAIIFVQTEPKNSNTSLFQIFERINTGGKTLTAQEIRNCVYQGEFNTLLFQLNNDANWRALLGRPDHDQRMLDMEFILRFFALQDKRVRESEKKQISLKKHLNTFMDSETEKDTEQCRASFEGAMLVINQLLGASAFQNYSVETGEFSGRFSPTIFDAIAIATANAIANNVDLKASTIVKQHKALLEDESFILFTTERTTNIDHINGRISLAAHYLYGVDDD
jgi:uncharacterized protein with ParB-like and HNH nuclease domain